MILELVLGGELRVALDAEALLGDFRLLGRFVFPHGPEDDLNGGLRNELVDFLVREADVDEDVLGAVGLVVAVRHGATLDGVGSEEPRLKMRKSPKIKNPNNFTPNQCRSHKTRIALKQSIVPHNPVQKFDVRLKNDVIQRNKLMIRLS